CENGSQSVGLHLLLKAFFLGAGFLCPVAFALNQAIFLKLTPLTLSSLTLFLIGSLYLTGFRIKLSDFSHTTNYSSIIWETGILICVFIQASFVLNAPLSDWDSYYYHLPLTQLIIQGSFSRDIGPSYNLEMM